MNARLHLLVAAAAAAALAFTIVACGDEDSNGATNNGDANNGGLLGNNGTSNNGATNNGATNNATNNGDANNGAAQGEITHVSTIPDGARPADAVRLIVLGDSISAGVGASRRSRAYYALLDENADDVYPDDADIDLTSLYGHDVELVNEAVGGATTATMRANQLPALAQRLGDSVSGHSVAVITIGGNDVTTGFAAGADLEGTYLDHALTNIRDTIEFLQDPVRFPDGTSVFIANVYDPGDGVGRVAGCFAGIDLTEASNALLTWARRYDDLAWDYGIGVVDALGAFRGHGFYFEDPANPYHDAADPTLWFKDDCIHPNDRGHQELRRLFFEAIDPSETFVAD